MQSRAGVMRRGLYGAWVHLSSAFWLIPRKTLQIHCTTVCTSKIHPRYFSGSVLIQKEKKKKKSIALIAWTKCGFQQGTAFFGMISKTKEIRSIYCVCCVGTLSKQTWQQTWQYPLVLSWLGPSHKTGSWGHSATSVTRRVSLGVVEGRKPLESFWGEPWLCNALYTLKTAQN